MDLSILVIWSGSNIILFSVLRKKITITGHWQNNCLQYELILSWNRSLKCRADLETNLISQNMEKLRPKVTVWCCVSAWEIISPYFFEEDGRTMTVNSERYQQMFAMFKIPDDITFDDDILDFETFHGCQDLRIWLQLISFSGVTWKVGCIGISCTSSFGGSKT